MAKGKISTALLRAAEAASSWVGCERGNISTMFVLSAGVMLVAGSAAVDTYSLMSEARGQQDLNDGAALMAARMTPENADQLREGVEAFLQNHSTNDYRVSVEEAARTWTVRMARDTPLAVGLVSAGDTRPVVTTATVNRPTAGGGGGGLDIAMVLDSTGSMNVGSGEDTRMKHLKRAADELLERIESVSEASVGGPDIRVGVVPFSRHVRLSVEAAGESWLSAAPMIPQGGGTVSWTGCVGTTDPEAVRPAASALDPILAVTGEDCPDALLEMGSDWAAIRSYVGALVPQGDTYLPSGVMWGWRLLDASEPYPNPRARTARRVMIVMSDGSNYAYPDVDGVHYSLPEYRSRNPKPNTRWMSEDARQRVTDACAAIKADGVEVHVIAYTLDPQTRAEHFASLRECASSPDTFYHARERPDIGTVFDDIEAAMFEMRLVR